MSSSPWTAVKEIKCGAGGAPVVGYIKGSDKSIPPCHAGIFLRARSECRLSLLTSMPLTDQLEWRGGLFLDSTSVLF